MSAEAGEVAPREADDVLPARAIALVALAGILAGGALCAAAVGLDLRRQSRLRPSGDFPESRLPPPRRAAGIYAEIFDVPHARPALADRKRALLQTYGWVDRARRIVRIPVERAMDLLASGALGAAGDAEQEEGP